MFRTSLPENHKKPLIRDVTEYETSRDYGYLFDLMQRSSVICIIDCHFRHGDPPRRDIAKTLCREGDYQISGRGNGYLIADSKEDFLRQCAIWDVEFIPPNKGLAKC